MVACSRLLVSEDDRKSERATRGISSPLSLYQTPLVARPLFQSSTLTLVTESLEQVRDWLNRDKALSYFLTLRLLSCFKQCQPDYLAQNIILMNRQIDSSRRKIYEVLAARMRKLITARSRKMLAKTIRFPQKFCPTRNLLSTCTSGFPRQVPGSFGFPAFELCFGWEIQFVLAISSQSVWPHTAAGDINMAVRDRYNDNR